MAAVQDARLLRRPTVSRNEVAFAHAGDLWIVGRDGGRARRLTVTRSVETDPRFSPDGALIAFTATVQGNTDVYVISREGGSPRRLTYHPGLDGVRGWTRDGSRVIFASSRGVLPTPIATSYVRLWTIGLDEGQPVQVPMPRAHTGVFSPDGARIAYEEIATEFDAGEAQVQKSQWRHYRGGRTHPIRLMNLADHSEQRVPWSDSNDSDPMWIGDTVYFVSDRNFTANLFAHRIGGDRVEQLTDHNDDDIMNASSGPDAIVYEQGGYIHLLEVPSGKSRRLHIQVEGDFPWALPQTRSVATLTRNAAVALNGKQVAFEARGEIFLQSAGVGTAINFTQSAGAHDRNPAWSPDGTQIAWLSDASGEYQLFVAEPMRRAQPRSIALPVQGYFSTPVWSPDGRQLLLRDNYLTLWLIELDSGKATRIDADLYDDPYRRIDPAWSGDSRWIAYSRNLPNRLRAIFLYSIEARQAHQITDADVDAISPAFDRDGRSLYFLVSTDYARNIDWSSMSPLYWPATRRLYSAALSASGGTDIEVDGIGKRVAALDIPAGDYAELIAGPPGVVFYTEHEKRGVPRVLTAKSMSLHRYHAYSRRKETFLQGIDAYATSSNGAQLLYRTTESQQWSLALADRQADGDDAAIDTGGLSMRVDPRSEWAHIFHEAWRIQRDYFYQPTMHGADWQRVREKFAAWLPHVNHRDDLGYLLAMVGGQLSVGHSALRGAGEGDEEEPARVGMLGADFVIANGCYRIQRIYRGDRWDPAMRAPLAAPGVDVKEGDCLLEVDGKPVSTALEAYAPFQGTAGKPVRLRVGPTPQAAGSRVITVTPIANEELLRTHEDWIERNRKRVDALSGGRIGYVWLPNTGPHGYDAFNRQFYSQLDKQGVTVDDRYNQGGYMAYEFVDALTRPQFGHLAMRNGAASPAPLDAIYGPKVMLINESSGSGGDALPYYFKLVQAGPLVGTRTWGGLVGVEEPPAPETLGGGGITAPHYAFYDTQGRWVIENEGIEPDIVVENTPADVIAGRDPQLERAVEEALKLLRRQPVPRIPKPAPPDRAKQQSE